MKMELECESGALFSQVQLEVEGQGAVHALILPGLRVFLSVEGGLRASCTELKFPDPKGI
jgi:hypothetical protein